VVHTDADAMAEALLADGYLVIDRLAPELTAAAMAELRADIDAAPVGHTAFLGARTKRLGGLLRRSSAVRELVTHPTIMALADRVLQPHCVRYQLNFSGIMHLLPGADAQVLHRDGEIYPFLHPSPPTLMPVMWALSDFTDDNGATQVVPGSHRWSDDRDPHPSEVVRAAMPAGSALVYLSGTIHGGGANTSSSERTGLALQYSLGWLRQEENQYLANPPEVARTFSDRLQRLIGYDYGAPYLGFVDGDSPQRLLGEPDPDRPRHRTTPEIDALADRMVRHRWGDVAAESSPTPSAEGSALTLERGRLGASGAADAHG
jgi:ectoine hydroxylase-related dioxygenase (phytanoyl-CoA dioxygenase family)